MDAEHTAAFARLTALLVRIERKIDRSYLATQQLLIGDLIMSAELDALTVQVTANTDEEASVALLLAGIAQQLRDAGTDRTKLTALASTLETSRAALAAAVVANTPAANPPPTP